ncbi:GDSL esterase/lipase At5g55050-like [Spinacia oleracea]|uniref:GDSL esterase/lipase At5g55050-like n=1 Tax=Spinacia oleracea TaxID=3562 RepID=A0ABM3QZA8_SPIOL|nr:GDSL esterase/lipase At5g55050-like [Spinacia oleracea]
MRRCTIIYLQFWFVLILSMKLSSAKELVPALFVFGDSLVDVGNNNYLSVSLAKGNFLHHGIDFPTHKPTGRFSNGKNIADFLAEKLGLPSSPPYLSLVHDNVDDFTKGVSFASAAAGILNTTSKNIYLPRLDGTDGDGDGDQLSHFTITMDEQVEYYVKVRGVLDQKLGASNAATHLAKSVFIIAIGSVDIGVYLGLPHTSLKEKGSPRQLVDSMVLTIIGQLKRIYNNGGRKFVMIGIGSTGCLPSERIKTQNETCNEEFNYWNTKYNQGLQLVLKELESELPDFRYSYFNTYQFLLNILEQPLAYGFKEVKAACCGLGRLNADVCCSPVSNLCPDRSGYVFWDLFHPTEAVSRLLIDYAFDGAQQYSFPGDIQRLVSM